MGQGASTRRTRVKIVIDTNVLFSMIFYPSEQMNRLIDCLQNEHELLVIEYVAEELLRVATTKKPDTVELVHDFLATVTLIPTVKAEISEILIRDLDDQPILNAAIAADVDITISGDYDFLVLDIDRPRIMKAVQFRHEFMESDSE